MVKVKRERRKPVTCPYCHTKMLCMDRFESISSLTKGLYVWYVCPRRSGEKGCGYSALLRISPKTKRPTGIVFSVKLKGLKKKKRTKK